MINRIYSVFKRTAQLGAYFACAVLLADSFLIAFEVIARKLFAFSIIGVDELSGYALAVSMAWGFGYVLFERAHLRVDAHYIRLPLKLRCILDVVSLLAFFLLIALVVARAAALLRETFVMNARAATPLATPLWIPQTIWFIGIVLFALCLVVVFARAAIALAKKDYVYVRQIAAAPSVTDSTDALPIDERKKSNNVTTNIVSHE
jgi:TRAP-type C4-dicarboxylate transport system permease small subunit